MKNYRIISAVAAIVILFGCHQDVLDLQPPPTIETPTGLPGTASFTKFVAVGNSLTAGYQAGALFKTGQEESLAKILATQFAYAGGSATFNQPLVDSKDGCYNPPNCTLGRLVLFDADGAGTAKSPSPTPAGAPTVPFPYNTASDDHIKALYPYTGTKSALNNFAVPGILLGQALTPATGGPAGNPYYNPYYARFASNPSTNGTTGSSIISDAVTALATGGTFFMFDLGNNDVLGYAVGGAEGDPNASPIFTSVGNFQTYYTNAVGALLTNAPNAKGVVANIPDVLKVPYFHLVAYNAIPLDAATKDQLNAGFAGYNTVMAATKAAIIGNPGAFGLNSTQAAGIGAEIDTRMITFVTGNNKIVITDEKLVDMGPFWDGFVGAGQMSSAQRAQLTPYQKIRQTTSTDLLPLSAGAVLGTTVGGNPQLINGLTVPLADKYVLIPSEQTLINDRVAAFNSIIAGFVASANATTTRLALADVNSELTAFITAGTIVDGTTTLQASIAPPYAAFSEDGVHPNGRGYAHMANIFIKAINSTFGATVPKVDISKYKGTGLPLNP